MAFIANILPSNKQWHSWNWVMAQSCRRYHTQILFCMKWCMTLTLVKQRDVIWFRKKTHRLQYLTVSALKCDVMIDVF
jgi:hypothetical protein